MSVNKKHQTPEEVERQKSRFKKWQKRNPSKLFKDYFAENTRVKLTRGMPHMTLGGNLHEGEFSSSGEAFFGRLLECGLRPGDTCVDYGCGTLRIGLHVIKFLQPGAYWGFDVDDFLLKEGRKLIGEELWAEKRPNLRVISPASVAEAAACNAEILFSLAVLFHVHPQELPEYIGNVMSLIGRGGQAVIGGPWSDEETVQFSGQSWAHAMPVITELVHDGEGRVEIVNETELQLEAFGRAAKTGIFRITR
jgi:hypothetical protein